MTPVGASEISISNPKEMYTKVDADFSMPGLRVYVQSGRDTYSVVIRSNERQEDWQVYLEDNDQDGALPGTTLIYKGNDYKIASVIQASNRSWVYRLNPWPHYETWYQVVELTPEKVRKRLKEKRASERLRKLSEISRYYEGFLGFLPGRWQEWLGNLCHFSPEQASRKNALMEYFVVFPVCAIGVLGPFRDFVASSIYAGLMVVLFFFLLAFEGAIRWGHISASSGPCGILVLEAVAWVLRVLWRIARWDFGGPRRRPE